MNNKFQVTFFHMLPKSYIFIKQYGNNATRKEKFSSKETAKNFKKRLSGSSEEACELLSEAFDNPESTPVHMTTNRLEHADKSEIIRKAIGELDTKDSSKLSNPYTLSKDHRETRCQV